MFGLDDVLGIPGAIAQTGLDVYRMGRQSDEASFQRDWEEHMSNTAYQRATADMKLAGINPMVAFQQGGASTPSGAVGDVPEIRDPVSSGLNTMLLSKNLDILEETRRKVRSDADTASYQSAIASFEADLAQWKRDAIGSNIKKFNAGVVADFEMKALAVPEQRAIAEMWEKMKKEGGDFGKFMQTFGPLILRLLK